MKIEKRIYFWCRKYIDESNKLSSLHIEIDGIGFFSDTLSEEELAQISEGKSKERTLKRKFKDSERRIKILTQEENIMEYAENYVGKYYLGQRLLRDLRETTQTTTRREKI